MLFELLKEALFTRYSVYILKIDSNGELYVYSHMYFHPFILYTLYTAALILKNSSLIQKSTHNTIVKLFIKKIK